MNKNAAQYHAHPTSNSAIAILKWTNGKSEKKHIYHVVYFVCTVSVYIIHRTWIILWRLSLWCVFALIADRFFSFSAPSSSSSSRSCSSFSWDCRWQFTQPLSLRFKVFEHIPLHYTGTYHTATHTATDTYIPMQKILRDFFGGTADMLTYVRWTLTVYEFGLHTAYMASYGMFGSCVDRASVRCVARVYEWEIAATFAAQMRWILTRSTYVPVNDLWTNIRPATWWTEKERWHYWYGHGQCVNACKSDNNEVGANILSNCQAGSLIYRSDANSFGLFSRLLQPADKDSVWKQSILQYENPRKNKNSIDI